MSDATHTPPNEFREEAAPVELGNVTALPSDQSAAQGDVMVRRPSFWGLADALQAYVETLDMIDAQLAGVLAGDERTVLTGERAEVQAAIECIAGDLVTKADNCAGVIRRMDDDVVALRTEEKRLADKRRSAERAQKWLKDYVCSVISEKFGGLMKTQFNTLRAQKNGGLLPLRIIATPPREYLRVTVEMPAADYDAVVRAASAPISDNAIALPPDDWRLRATEPDAAKIRRDLDAGWKVFGAEFGERGRHLRLT